MGLLSNRHNELLANIRKEVISFVRVEESKYGAGIEALEHIKMVLEARSYETAYRDGKNGDIILEIKRNNRTFEDIDIAYTLRMPRSGKHIMVGRNVTALLVCKSADKETLHSIKKEPYRFRVVKEKPEMVAIILSYDWSKLYNEGKNRGDFKEHEEK